MKIYCGIPNPQADPKGGEYQFTKFMKIAYFRVSEVEDPGTMKRGVPAEVPQKKMGCQEIICHFLSIVHIKRPNFPINKRLPEV